MELHNNRTEVLVKVIPSMMKEAHELDNNIIQVVQKVKAVKKLKLSQIWTIKYKNVRKYLHQLDQLILKEEVLYQICKHDGST